MLDDLSFGKILIILLVIVILFGSKKLPDLAKGIGKGIREFKKAVSEDENETPENPGNKEENKETK